MPDRVLITGGTGIISLILPPLDLRGDAARAARGRACGARRRAAAHHTYAGRAAKSRARPGAETTTFHSLTTP